jgi:predicted enzyme involved in methoxymalonyl-ACP biosynthesis
VEALLQDSRSRVCIMRVTDKFSDYGMVGVCILSENVVTTLAVSCRVIGLDVGLPFLVTCIEQGGGVQHGLKGLVTTTTQNEPARNVFARAGFEAAAAAGEWVLAAPERLYRGPFPQTIVASSEVITPRRPASSAHR